MTNQNQNIRVGVDIGNSKTKIVFHFNGKTIRASIPSRYAFSKPPGEISKKTGQELRPKAFKLIVDNRELWFGQDVLAVSTIQEIDMAKYEPSHLSILFRAALYQACKSAKIDVSNLGHLEIVASMPPGLFQDATKNKLAQNAFRKAFCRTPPTLWIRDGGSVAGQIITRFLGLQQEAVSWGQNRKRASGPYSLTVDLGGGTNDYALFNGDSMPMKTWTDNAGLLHVYEKMNRVDPSAAELKTLREKNSLHTEISAYYNEVKRKVQMITLKLPGSEISELNIIGGGASLMTPKIKATFAPLATKVTVLGEYANAEANLKAAK
jgi:hypothetical protein